MSDVKKYFDLEFNLWSNFGTLKHIGDNLLYIDNPSEGEFYFQGMIKTTLNRFEYNNEDIGLINNCREETKNIFRIPFEGKDIQVADSDDQWDYYRATDVKPEPVPINDLKTVETNDIVQFSKVLGLGFDLPKTFINNFAERLNKVTKTIDSRFFFLEKNNAQIGCCSYHRDFEDELYCLMNVTILKGHRGNEYSSILIKDSMRQINNTNIYSRTNNVNMKNIFLKIGLEKVGCVYIKKG